MSLTKNTCKRARGYLEQYNLFFDAMFLNLNKLTKIFLPALTARGLEYFKSASEVTMTLAVTVSLAVKLKR